MSALLSPRQIKSMRLDNRVFVAPMCQYLPGTTVPFPNQYMLCSPKLWQGASFSMQN